MLMSYVEHSNMSENLSDEFVVDVTIDVLKWNNCCYCGYFEREYAMHTHTDSSANNLHNMAKAHPSSTTTINTSGNSTNLTKHTHTLNRTLWWWLLCTCKYVSTRNRHENVSTAEIYILYIKYILSSVQIYSIKMHVPNASVSLFCFVSAPPSHLYLIQYDCIRSIQRPCEMSNEHKITK